MKKAISKKTIFIFLFIGIIVSAGYTWTEDRDFKLVKSLDIFYSLFRELNLFYVDSTEPEELIETGIQSMLNSLDPYTTYIPESEMDNFKFMTTGKYGGIGSLIRRKGEFTIIAEPYENSPAARAGLMAGDIILSIDGASARGNTLSEISEKLKGTPETKVKLLIERPGIDKNLKVIITREQIHINNVSYSGLLNSETGYIRLSNFTQGAGEEVHQAYQNLKNEGMNQLILDLRGNPGGLLIEAVRVCNLFIQKGELIVSTRGRVTQWDQEHYTTKEPVDTLMPIIILVNRGSASASEIVAGAMQDLDRAVVIGQRTFGKGLVQTTRPLKYNSQLKVTTAKYYIPSGRCIQALDYSNRNEDGSVGKVPDSLISEFQTRNGRKVYDGGGILPDSVIVPETYSSLSMELYAQNLIFDFATDYIAGSSEKPELSNYSISDKDYEEFISFVKKNQFTYKTNSERALNKLILESKKDKYYEFAESEFNSLREKLTHDNEKDLKRFKPEIIELINQEIIGRYYFQSGKIELSLPEDKLIKTALPLFSKPQTYNMILAYKEN